MSRTSLGLLGLLVIAASAPTQAVGQASESWDATAHDYDSATAARFVTELRSHYTARRGALADELYAMNDGLSRTPHDVESRPRPPLIAPIKFWLSASHLMRYQASQGGSLGRLYDASEHPLGIGWFPNSMFAQSGGVFAQWGHARLIASVRSFMDQD